MRSTLTELFHVFLSFPFWVFVGLVALAVHAWRARQSRLHRFRHVLAGVAALFYLASMPLVAIGLERWLEHHHPVPRVEASDRRDDNVILVLTAGWLRSTPTGYEQKMGEAGYERIVTAVRLWREIGGRIVFTGAPNPDGSGSAAAAMARHAHALGVPQEALLVESASLNTHENLRYSRRLVGSAGRIWLVTSAQHMPRSVLAARAEGLAVTPYPCDFRADERVSWTLFVPNNMTRGALERSLHELVGILAYRLRGWG